MRIGFFSTRRVLLGLGLAFLLGYAFSYFRYHRALEKHEEKKIERVSKQVQTAAAKLDAQLRQFQLMGDSLADLMSSGHYDSAAVMHWMEQRIGTIENVYGIGYGQEPYAFVKSKELFAPFYVKPLGEKAKLTYVDTAYDYRKSRWYYQPLANGKAWFEPPYFGIVSQTLMAEYSAPFYDPYSGDSIGIVYIDISLEGVNNILNSIELGNSGYPFLLSKGGNYMSHPISAWVKNEENIKDKAQELDSPQLYELFSSLAMKEVSYVDYTNPVSGQESRVVMTKLQESGWKMGVTVLKQDFSPSFEWVKHQKMFLQGLLITAFSFFLLLLATYAERYFAFYWLVAGGLGLLFTLNIAYVWHLILSQPIETNTKEELIVTEQVVRDKLVKNYDSLLRKMHESSPHIIPTGLFIEHIEFSDANTLSLSGYVWQKYDTNEYHLSKGNAVIFPETAPTSQAVELSLAFEDTTSDGLTKGWYFRTSVRNELDYSYYPFDRQTIRLKILPAEVMGNIMLTPDLESYTVRNPSMLPGITNKAILPGWDFMGSYFNYQFERYTTTFGLKSTMNNHAVPELAFNVVIKRDFLGPFISNIIPLLVISILLFTVVTTATHDKLQSSRVGFTGFGVLELAAAFLFVAILAQIDLRNKLDVDIILYMDYFYFMIYFIILLYGINSVLFTRESKMKLVHYRNNIYPRVFYWPFFMGGLLLITFILFY